MGPGPHQVSKLQKTTTLSTNAQSIVVLCGFQGPLRLAWYKQVSLFFCISGTQRMRRGHLIGAVPAQKVLKGSETETRELLGGTEEKGISLTRVHSPAHRENQRVFTNLAPLKFDFLLPLCIQRCAPLHQSREMGNNNAVWVVQPSKLNSIDHSSAREPAELSVVFLRKDMDTQHSLQIFLLDCRYFSITDLQNFTSSLSSTISSTKLIAWSAVKLRKDKYYLK